jgi:hypothetical protein
MKEYHPECHDAGKLLYTEIGGKDKHWRFIEKMEKPWQQVIAQHHYNKEDDIIYFPSDLYVFLASVADRLAASTVRLEEWGGKPNYFTNRLWKRDSWDFINFTEKGEAQKRIVKEVRRGESYEVFREELIKYFDNEPVDFLDRYRDLLHVRAEDASPGANIVSLYVHSIVTKKFYFLLNELIEEGNDEVKKVINEIKERIENKFSYKPKDLKNEISKLVKNLGDLLEFNVIYYKIDIPHYIFRVHDLNLFRELKEEIEKIRKDYEDNFFFFFGFSFVLLCGDNKQKEIESKLNYLVEKYKIVLYKTELWYKSKNDKEDNKNLDEKKHKVKFGQLNEVLKGLRGQIEKEREVDFGQENSNVERSLKILMKKIEEKFEGYLCEVCRLDRGKRYEEDGKAVYLCSHCYIVRRRGKERGGFVKYASWEEGYVCALGFRIEFEEIFGWFDELYKDYVEQMKKEGIITKDNEKKELKIKNPLALAEEFIESFNNDVIFKVKGEIAREFSNGNFEEISDNFLLVHLEERGDVLGLFDLVYKCLKEEMSSLFYGGIGSPVRIYFGVGHVKHPFFAFYRKFVQDWGERKDICFEVVGEIPVYMSFVQFEKVIRFKEYIMNNVRDARSKIHQMLEIARVSEALGRLAYVKSEMGERGGNELIEGIGYMGLMTLFKIFDMYISKGREVGERSVV